MKEVRSSVFTSVDQEGQNWTQMRLGTQRGPITTELLQFCARHGVEGICLSPKVTTARRWDPEEVSRTRDLCESHGIRLEILGGALTSAGIERQIFPHILLGQDPERDREMDLFCEMIAVAGRVGVPCIKYNLAILPVLRTKPTVGRGGVSYSTWSLKEAPDGALTPAGRMTDEIFWERIAYFLKRMLPVASEYKIRMACHPHDPGVPPGGYRGVDRVLGTVEGLKRFVDISPSPYHGLNLCVGTVAEMLQNPREEIYSILRYFGERNRLFNIHFRNIRGRRDNFYEVYPDEGDLDMFRVIKTLKEVGYKHLIMPDHMPRHPEDPQSRQAFAFAYGYIKGLLQALASSG